VVRAVLTVCGADCPGVEHVGPAPYPDCVLACQFIHELAQRDTVLEGGAKAFCASRQIWR
jgi:hypothetical protein